jgi:DNA-binding NarL/FixJ family response regulator
MATTPKQLKLLIVDDHLMVREGLRMLIESQPTMSVIGMASNRSEALEQVKRATPDLILLDLDLAGEDALSFVPELSEAATNARILILTALTDAEVHRRAVRLGALGVVLKEHAPDILIKAINKVLAGEVWLDRTTMASLLRETANKAPDKNEERIGNLTSRERQVIALIAEGLRNKHIAERLFISETTVTHHLSSIFSKLGVSDRLELVIYAFGHNLAKLPNP